jgi:hypothetical protein
MESQNKYIIYFHPAHGTPMFHAFEKYWNVSTKACKMMNIKNVALLYPYHATLTGFFTLDDANVADFVVKFRSIFHNVGKKTTIPEFSYSKHRFDNGMHCASLRFSHDDIEKKIRELQKATENLAKITPKNDLHFSLYYPLNDRDNQLLYETTKNLVDDIFNTKFSQMSVCMWKTDGKNWTIVECL